MMAEKEMLVRSHSIRYILLVVLALLLPNRAGADQTSQAKAAIDKTIKSVDVMLFRHDVNGVMSFYAKDFVYTNLKGQKTNWEGARSGIHLLLANLKKGNARSRITHFALKGNQAALTHVAHVEMSVWNEHQQKIDQNVIDSTNQETWEKTGSKWLLKTQKTIEQRMAVNRKLLYDSRLGDKNNK